MLSILKRFINFEADCLQEWTECHWRQFNIAGKVLFVPYFLFGLVFLPIFMPLLYLVMNLLT